MKFLERLRLLKPTAKSGGGRVIQATPRRVRKAVFPVAGLGTRFLPATKAVPKEMLPIVDRPLVQYAVDEAISAGIDEMIFVTHRSKRAIEDHFDRAVELERELERAGKHALLADLAKVAPPHVRFSFARQTAPLGLGHAVWCARHLIGNEPFAVVLPDDLLDGDPPVLAQMVECYRDTGSSVIAVEHVGREDTSRYGIVDPGEVNGRSTRIAGIVEKPQPTDAPSTLAVVGRYVFSPIILDCLQDLEPGAGNEIQLTDGIARLLAHEPAFAYSYVGRRYDCGSKLGFLEATVDFALKDPQLSADFRRVLERLSESQPAAPAVVNSDTSERRPLRHLTLVSH